MNGVGERERETETERERETERDKERQRQRDRDRERMTRRGCLQGLAECGSALLFTVAFIAYISTFLRGR